jgi:hypothetical protein
VGPGLRAQVEQVHELCAPIGQPPGGDAAAPPGQQRAGGDPDHDAGRLQQRLVSQAAEEDQGGGGHGGQRGEHQQQVLLADHRTGGVGVVAGVEGAGAPVGVLLTDRPGHRQQHPQARGRAEHRRERGQDPGPGPALPAEGGEADGQGDHHRCDHQQPARVRPGSGR